MISNSAKTSWQEIYNNAKAELTSSGTSLQTLSKQVGAKKQPKTNLPREEVERPPVYKKKKVSEEEEEKIEVKSTPPPKNSKTSNKKRSTSEKMKGIPVDQVKIIQLQYPVPIKDPDEDKPLLDKNGAVRNGRDGKPLPRGTKFMVQAKLQIGDRIENIRYQIGKFDEPDYIDTKDPETLIQRGKHAKGYDSPFKKNYYRFWLKNTKPSLWEAWCNLRKIWNLT